MSGTAAQAVVEARPGRAVYAEGRDGAPSLLVGRETAWVLEKSRGRQGGEEEKAELVVAGAVLPEGEAKRSAKGRTAGEAGEAVPAWGAAAPRSAEPEPSTVRRRPRGRHGGRRGGGLCVVPPPAEAGSFDAVSA